MEFQADGFAAYSTVDELVSALSSADVNVLLEAINRLKVHLQILQAKDYETTLLAPITEYIDKYPNLDHLWAAFELSLTIHRLAHSVLSVFALILGIPVVLSTHRLRWFRAIIRGQTKQVFRNLTSGTPLVVSATLQVLAKGARIGGCRDLQETSLLKPFPQFLSPTQHKNDSEKQGSDVRTSYIQYIIALLSAGDSAVKKHLLDTKGFVTGIFRELVNDPSWLIDEVLTTLETHILHDSILPKSTKISLFNIGTLEQLSKLYSLEPEITDATVPITPPRIHQLLLSLCTIPGQGVCFYDNGLYGPANPTPGTVSATSQGTNAQQSNTQATRTIKIFNRTLGLYILWLKPMDNPYHEELLFKILLVAPELRAYYLINASGSLEPRASLRWMTNIDLFCRVLALPISPLSIERHIDVYPPNPPILTTLIANIVPSPPLSRSILSRSLLHESPVVRLLTCRLLLSILHKATTMCNCLNDGMMWWEQRQTISQMGEQSEKENWRRARNHVISDVFRVLPDKQTVFGLLQKCLTDSASSPYTESTYWCLIKILALCCRLNIEFKHGFDYAKLLNTTPPIMLLPDLITLLSASSLTLTPASLAAVLYIYVSTQDNTHSAAAMLVTESLSTTAVFETCPREISLWLGSLDGISSPTAIVFVTNLFGKTMGAVNRYIDIITSAIATMSFEHSAMFVDALPFSPMLVALIEELNTDTSGDEMDQFALRLLHQICLIGSSSLVLDAICNQQGYTRTQQLFLHIPSSSDVENSLYQRLANTIAYLQHHGEVRTADIVACLAECRVTQDRERSDNVARTVLSSPAFHSLFATHSVELAYIMSGYGNAELALPLIDMIIEALCLTDGIRVTADGHDEPYIIALRLLRHFISDVRLQELAQLTQDASLLQNLSNFVRLPLSCLNVLMIAVNTKNSNSTILRLLEQYSEKNFNTEVKEFFQSLSIPKKYMKHLLANDDNEVTTAILIRLVSICPHATIKTLEWLQSHSMAQDRAVRLLAKLVPQASDATMVSSLTHALKKQKIHDYAITIAENVELCRFIVQNMEASVDASIKMTVSGIEIGEMVAKAHSQSAYETWITLVLKTLGQMHRVDSNNHLHGNTEQAALEGRIALSLRSSKINQLDASSLAAFLVNVLQKTPSSWTLLLVYEVVLKYQRNVDSQLDLEALYKLLINSIDRQTLVVQAVSPTKTAFLLVLHTLVLLKPERLCKSDYLNTLLSAYNATLHPADCLILDLLRTYELYAATPMGTRIFAWGSNAEIIRLAMDNSQINVSLTVIDEMLDHIDRKRMLQLVRELPIVQPLEGIPDELAIIIANYVNGKTVEKQALYDLSWFLPLCCKVLECDSNIDVRKLIASNLIGLAVSALSSENRFVRQAGYMCLDKFYPLLKTAKFRERDQVLLLLTSVKYSINDRFTPARLPSLITSFVGQSLAILLTPEHYMYLHINKYLLAHPVFNSTDIPLFYDMLSASGPDHVKERRWMLRLIQNGVRNEEDYQLLKRRHVWEIISSLANSTLSDTTISVSMFDLLSHLIRIPTVLRDLLLHGGLLPCLSIAISTLPLASFRTSETVLRYLDILSNIQKELTQASWNYVDIQREQINLATVALLGRILRQRPLPVDQDRFAWWTNIMNMTPEALAHPSLQTLRHQLLYDLDLLA